ncbi:hypothetical protein BBO99_00005972 [Phytophthora kernoviae]|uniref:Uncharacterized protein n=2 Tax=Phytophthora kernoviae TaxID=325452 RepID=A0A3R7J623_9STRA|nr:hypothetical protein G195_006664 [Phytophthora kernoviae 00238/432]KAG2522335.1 hypothetical protein JM16_005727 [Phytophthora kernoviae]KAG2523960.1 hypothetical protein JM18_005488 [Phytophthora kernoviae]RLN26796.1 hypothetical protein BBI17_009081 [Phytophthora kernoviae]RLN78425.1 hypothetical protein BBO99_00005972 [Phytophthora kernoviae]
MNAEVQRLRAFIDARKRRIKAAEKRYDIQTVVSELRELAAPLFNPERFSPTWKNLYLEFFYRDVTAFLLGFVAVHLEICLSDQDRDQAFDVFFDGEYVPPSRAIAALTATLSATKIGVDATDKELEQDIEASITQCIRLLEKVIQAGGVEDAVVAMLEQEQQPIVSSGQSVIGFQVLVSQLSSLPEFAQHEWITKLCKGVQDHMSNSLERVRILGMRVAESLSQVIASEKPLDFGLDDDDSLAIYGCPVMPEDLEESIGDLSLNGNLAGEEVQRSRPHTVDNHKTRRKKPKKGALKPFTLDPDELVLSDDEDVASDSGDSNSCSDDSDSDSDMSLEAYDLQDDEEDLTAKRPLYLKDLIAGLLSDDDREKTEAALTEAEGLLRRRPRDLNDKAQEVVRALLRLEDKYTTLHFVKLRSQALVAVCVLAPTQSLPYLCSQALEREQLLQSRIDVLQTMTSAAQELSERGGGYQRPRGPKTLLYEQVGSTSSDDAVNTAGLEERTMQKLKTRRWGYRRDPLAAPKRNAFEPNALAFFSPLLFGSRHNDQMATVETGDGASPVSSAKLTELGKALDQASISSTGGVTSPASTHEAPTDDQDEADMEEDDDDEETVANEKVPGAPAAKLPAKSPKKRGRTDSLKKMLPAPASQRHKQGHWTPEEDAKLRDLVAEGKKNWGQVASLIPGRTSYTEDEDKIIVEMQAKLGNRWSIIAQQLKV